MEIYVCFKVYEFFRSSLLYNQRKLSSMLAKFWVNFRKKFSIYICFRAIFRWISIKDLNKIKFDKDVDPDSPLGLLRGIKFGTESYHDLFKRLCR